METIQKLLDTFGLTVGRRTYTAVIVFVIATGLIAAAQPLDIAEYVGALKTLQALAAAGALAALRAAKK